ncbi:MAG: Radical SAM additional 4Fe4S-binding domain protein [Parcubacteria group bacterium GW2011_GWE2_40_8]|nr:MAG: Radical SAM additional 4Fe4S-binding domain protein [Parcubacteria group bacterium GW2011_GWE2_40_8]
MSHQGNARKHEVLCLRAHSLNFKDNKEDLMKLSRFVHTIPVDKDMVALYHSLNIKVIFVSRELINQIEGLNKLDAYSDKLYSAGMVVKSEDEDKNLLDKTIKSLMSLPSPVSVMYLLLTDACNLACDYCFIENQIPEEQSRIFMSTETAKKSIDFFAEAIKRHPDYFEKKKTIIFYGGEPLMNKKVFMEAIKYIAHLKEKGSLPKSLSINMVSNGLFFTSELADFIREKKVNVSISIDGEKIATNLHRRDFYGEPIFDRVMKKIKLLKSKDIPVGISCTINEETIKNQKSTIEFLINEIGVKGLGFNILARGHSIKLREDYETRAAEFIINAYKIFREKGIYEDRIMRKINSFSKQKIHPYDCAAGGGRQLVVAPDGQVGICHGYIGSRKHFVGTVFDNELIVEDTPTYKEWKKRSPITMEKCQSCVALGTCGGGCPCDAEISKGSIWELDERFCVHAKMTIDWIIRDLWLCIKAKAQKPVLV